MSALETSTQTWVGPGSPEASLGCSAASSLKILTKTGMTKTTIATSTTSAKPKMSAGYISADLTWRRSVSAFSTWKAIRSSASSRRPDCSPERTIARKRRSKTFGWRSIACARELPASTSSLTPATASRIISSWVCSSQGVQGTQHRHTRGDQGRELAREDRQRPHVDALPALEEVLDIERLDAARRRRGRSARAGAAARRPGPWIRPPARRLRRNPDRSMALKAKVVAPAISLSPPSCRQAPEVERLRRPGRCLALELGPRPSSRFSSSGTEARCSARERVIFPERTSRARSASIVCIPTAPAVCTAA